MTLVFMLSVAVYLRFLVQPNSTYNSPSFWSTPQVYALLLHVFVLLLLLYAMAPRPRIVELVDAGELFPLGSCLASPAPFCLPRLHLMSV